MSKNSFADVTNDVKTMLAGLKNNPDAVAKRGLDKDFTTKMENILSIVQRLDNEQEALKAKLKMKTSEVDAELVNIRTMYSEAKKVVKMAIDQAGWREFGIEDTK